MAVVLPLEGQVVHVRRCGAQLTFVDVLVGPDELRVELIVRAPRVPKLCKLGDVVEVTEGTVEQDGHAVQLTSAPTVLRAWRAVGAGRSFVPRPPPSRIHVDDPTCCVAWLNQRRCPRAQSCPFAHPPPESAEFAAALAASLAALRARRAAVVFDADDPHGGRKVSKRLRASCFAHWLVAQWRLGPDSVVLDVAGGRGRLSCALLAAGVGTVVLVDPRTDHIADAAPGLVRHCTAFDEGYEPPQRITHVVGLHPDQATNAIVMWATARQLPVAIGESSGGMEQEVDAFSHSPAHSQTVPCCLFVELFPRHLADGQVVVTYEQLVQWLVERSAGTKAFLPMQGRNVVVFTEAKTGASL